MHPTAAVFALKGWTCHTSVKDAAVWAVMCPDAFSGNQLPDSGQFIGHRFRVVGGVQARWQIMLWPSHKLRQCAWTEVPPGVWGMFDLGWLE